MSKNEKIITLGSWLIIVTVTVIYVIYFQELKSIWEFIIAVAPAVIFFTGGILIFSRDEKIIKTAKAKEETGRTIQLEWGQALKHDIISYGVPVIILALPFFIDQKPTLVTVFQAVVAFLAFVYLKFIYWGEL